ncbi:MAG: amidase [Acidimicrobiales bacterium]|nr:amidase [Acidimicrobiales bacterium]
MSDAFAALDATAQADLVRRGEVTPAELVDAAIDRIEALNPTLNAVIWSDPDAARRAARSPRLPDGPLRGVPFLLKDIGATQAGLPYWAGSGALRDRGHRLEHDTVLGARFREAGLVTLGKTNLPELGSCPTTQTLAFGPASNPWDLSRSPAGSSGGAAAAVSAGLVPVAHANDGGGSTRLPAAWCGLVGLKTSRGRMPQPTATSRLVSELVVSRTVRDTAAVLDATHGHVPADLYQLPAPERPYTDELGADPGRLRMALLTEGGEYDVDPECVLAAERAASVLAGMGHGVEPVDGRVLFGGDGRVNGTLWMASIAAWVAELSALAGGPLGAADLEPYNWAAAERGKALGAVAWIDAQARQQAWAAGVFDWMNGFDVLITPTAGCPPLPTDELWPAAEEPWKIGRVYGRIGRFTLPFNATGHPAVSLPLHWTPDGLPVGVQLVAGMGREDVLLRLASRLEEAMPWRDRRPPIFA